MSKLLTTVSIALPVALFLLVLYIVSPAATVSVLETVPPHIPSCECLTWDEAKAKHNISGEVLLEYMIDQDCEKRQRRRQYVSAQ